MVIENPGLQSRILPLINIGILVQDIGGSIVYANEVAASMLGFKTAKELANMPVKSVLKYIKPGHLPTRQVLRGKPSDKMVLQHRRPEQTEKKWILVQSVPMLDRKGNVEYIANIFQDITDRKKEDESVDHFVAAASHELKTPLASIKALNQLMEKNIHENRFEGLSAYMKKIDNKLDILTRIINDFLDSTKIRVGNLDLSPEIFEFDDFIDETVSDMQDLFTKHRILKKGFTHKTIVADRLRIRQVLENLLRNACKYSPQADSITVTVSSAKNTVRVSVRDYGVGIEESEQNRIFEPFFRGKKQNARNESGLGLGLYLSSHIVKLHGGKIGVKSSVGKGSEFFFSLPLKLKQTAVTSQF